MPSNKDAKDKKPEYTLLILPSAQKQLNKLPNAIATRIEDKMMELEQDNAVVLVVVVVDEDNVYHVQRMLIRVGSLVSKND